MYFRYIPFNIFLASSSVYAGCKIAGCSISPIQILSKKFITSKDTCALRNSALKRSIGHSETGSVH